MGYQLSSNIRHLKRTVVPKHCLNRLLIPDTYGALLFSSQLLAVSPKPSLSAFYGPANDELILVSHRDPIEWIADNGNLEFIQTRSDSELTEDFVANSLALTQERSILFRKLATTAKNHLIQFLDVAELRQNLGKAALVENDGSTQIIAPLLAYLEQVYGVSKSFSPHDIRGTVEIHVSIHRGSEKVDFHEQLHEGKNVFIREHLAGPRKRALARVKVDYLERFVNTLPPHVKAEQSERVNIPKQYSPKP